MIILKYTNLLICYDIARQRIFLFPLHSSKFSRSFYTVDNYNINYVCKNVFISVVIAFRAIWI